MGIRQLEPVERTALDRDRIYELGERLGPARLEEFVCVTMEDLAFLLCRAQREFDRGGYDQLRLIAMRAQRVAAEIGLPVVARVASDLQSLTEIQDSVAVAAVSARLQRLGEAALFSQLDAGDPVT